jgi:Trk K+ transport system NAD-binding subunit
VTLAIAIALGTFLYAISPHKALDGQRPTLIQSLYGGWMALLAQPLYNPPENWYLILLCALYPLLGAVVIGEGVIRLALLMMSKRRGEKEWTRVMVSTYRDHIVICGLGHLGFRVIEQLLASNIQVVALERSKTSRFINEARDLGVPVLIRDMKDDDALIDAGIKHARAVIIATNDALANLEVAMDARRMNPLIRVVMRMFDEQIAAKISSAMDIDVAFSSSQLAAPVVAALALQTKSPHPTDPPHPPGQKVLATTTIGGVSHVTVEVIVQPHDAFAGHSIQAIDATGARVLAHASGSSPLHTNAPQQTIIAPGDTLVLHTPASRLTTLTATTAAPGSHPK